MKRIVCVMLACCLLLCSCGKAENDSHSIKSDEILTITGSVEENEQANAATPTEGTTITVTPTDMVKKRK